MGCSFKLFLFFLALVGIEGCLLGTKEAVGFDKNNHGPMIKQWIDPVYPPEAMKKGIEGTVWIKIKIDSTGRSSAFMIEKTPDSSLNDAALDAAAKTQFLPAVMDGRPVAVWFTIPFEVKRKD